jgi:hypothetical protein
MNRKETLATVAVVALFVVFGAIVLKLSSSSSSAASAQAESVLAPLPVGKQLTVPGVDWKGGQRTLLLVLQKGCHFCSESAPFYRKLALKVHQAKAPVQVVAVLPQDVPVGQQYLLDLGIPMEHVASAPMQSLGVEGTPTLILVDPDGKIVDSWVGELVPERESQVMNRLFAPV